METRLDEQRITVIKAECFIETALEQFYFDRKSASCRESTIQYYQAKLSVFVDFLKSREIKYIEQITANDIREFMVHLETTGHNTGGVHAFYRSIRTFLRWTDFEDLTNPKWKNPIKKVKAPRVDQPVLDPVDMADVSKLLETCSAKRPLDLRDAAMIMMLIDTAMRANELTSLDIKDVDLNSGTVLIRTSKNRRSRTAFIGKTARRALRAYLRLRDDDNPALWIQQDDSRLTYWGARALLDP